MAREINYRVMNSLQFVSSMLMMHSRERDLTDAMAEDLMIASSRAAAVARANANDMPTHLHDLIDPILRVWT